MRNLIVFLTLVFLGLQAVAVSASPGSLFTYEGVLTDTGGTPITTSQNVKFQVLAGSCVVYEESQNITPGSDGEFSVVVGAGTRSDTTTNTADRIFASSGTVECSSSSNISVSGFGNRSLRVIVGATTLTPDVTLGNVPSAINAQKLADKGTADFVNINSASGVTQTNVESIFNRFTKLDDLLNNLNAGSGTFTGNITGNAATATTISGTVAIANGGTGATTAATARTNLGIGTLALITPTGTADNTTYLRGDGSWAVPSGGGSGDITDVLAGTGLTGGGTTGSVTLNLSAVGTAGTYAKVTTDAQGRVTSGSVLAVADIPTMDASKISSGQFPDARIADLSVDKITNGSGKFFNYKPDNVVCASGEFLKYDSTLNAGNGAWVCATIKLSELRNITNTGSAFASGVGFCTAGQTLAWSSITDQFACQSIAILTTQISDVHNLVRNGGSTTGANLVVGTTDGFGVSLVTGGNERLRIDSGGFVGINLNGVVSPAAPLDVGGNLLLRKPADVNETTGSLGYFSGDVFNIMSGPNMNALRISAAKSTASIIFITQGSAERMRITESGKVGIGVASPQATLDIDGQVRLKKNATAPETCSTGNDGTLALTSGYKLCACKGSYGWVSTADGTSACTW